MGRRGAFSSGAFASHLKAKTPSPAVTETFVAEAATASNFPLRGSSCHVEATVSCATSSAPARNATPGVFSGHLGAQASSATSSVTEHTFCKAAASHVTGGVSCRQLPPETKTASEAILPSSTSSSSKLRFKLPPDDSEPEASALAKVGAASNPSPSSRTTSSDADAVKFDIYSPRREEGALRNPEQQLQANAAEKPELQPREQIGRTPQESVFLPRRTERLPSPDRKVPVTLPSTDRKRRSMQALHEAAEGSVTIAYVLAAAKPQWTEKDVAAVTNKLLRIEITTVAKLMMALAGDINGRLRAAGYKKALSEETLNDLKQSLGLDEFGLPRASREETPPPPPCSEHFDISDAGNNPGSLDGLEDVKSQATYKDKLELRYVIMTARPQWTAPNADVVVQKLINANVFDLQTLAEALSDGLNDRLQKAPDLNKQSHGPRARSVRVFATSFIGALRVAVDEALEQKFAGTNAIDDHDSEVAIQDDPSQEIKRFPEDGVGFEENAAGCGHAFAESSTSASSVQNVDQQFMDSPSPEDAVQKLPSRSCQAEAETDPLENLEDDPSANESQRSARANEIVRATILHHAASSSDEGQNLCLRSAGKVPPLATPGAGECECLVPCSSHDGTLETDVGHTRTRILKPASSEERLASAVSPGMKVDTNSVPELLAAQARGEQMIAASSEPTNVDASTACLQSFLGGQERLLCKHGSQCRNCIPDHLEGSSECKSSATTRDPHAPADERGAILPTTANMMPLTSAPNIGASQLAQATLTSSETPLLALSEKTLSPQEMERHDDQSNQQEKAAFSEREKVEQRRPLTVADRKIAALEESARRAESILLRPVDYEMVCSDAVCIHRKPCVNSPVLGQLKKGACVSGFPGAGWLRVTRLPSDVTNAEAGLSKCIPRLQADNPENVGEACGHIYDDQSQECGWIYIGMQLAARCLKIKVSERFADALDLRWPGLPGGVRPTTIYTVEWRPVGKALATNVVNTVNRGLSAGSQYSVRQPHHCLTELPVATRMRIRVIAQVSEREQKDGLNPVRVLGPWTEVTTEKSLATFLRGKAPSCYEDEPVRLCPVCAVIGQKNRIGECIACKALKKKQSRALGDSVKDDNHGSLEHLYVSRDWVSDPQTVIQAADAADKHCRLDEEEPVIEELYDDVDWTFGPPGG